jgi:hypothetical protein
LYRYVEDPAQLEAMQYGLLSEGPSLVALEQMLAQVFIPLFAAQTGSGDAFADNIINELVGNTAKVGAVQVKNAVDP